MFKKMFALVALLVVAAFGAACGGASSAPQTGALTGKIKVDGSSTVFPISEAVGEEFGKKFPKVKVPVGISGTGGGFKKFCSDSPSDWTDVSDASRPIKQSEIDQCKKVGVEFIELPVAYDGLAIVANPKNTWAQCLTVAELKKMWEPDAQGKITNWNQIRASFPDKPLKLYGPGTDSGTFDYFTEAINGKEKASRGDFTPSEDDNVLVQGVGDTRNEGGLGYFGVAYYEANKDKLKLVAVDKKGDGKCNLPTFDNVKTGVYDPLSRPLFIYVNKKSAERVEVKEFINFYIANATKLVQEVGYISLPDNVTKLVAERFAKGVTGSMYAGKSSEPGMTLEELLKK
ncbi:MAG: PstS family phosphate ABC transporter substrate-binding protein [Chloroflexi bacterium]|nr:PstS family phosphate ABC transporter substrate-binding protein [Chloroflexota bacterium]